MRDGVVERGSLVEHYAPLSPARGWFPHLIVTPFMVAGGYDFLTNASRCSSDTPARLSSKVKPCSMR
ncbi:hypothetical protein C3469_07815 [Mycobacterium kansasii]|nr:hypothetical protein [Mycobacterium kansasii]POX72510.1 hypothetical protein C3475_15625 [Mycobacterium kansasii]POX77533.1 hypothetical protein C3471_17765 [Mycobacterium kansasii]POX82856.1 hypothetical protein C3470_13165 [Mycobacterium kansasii]POX88705.1 hypothetical protein C3B43_13330 [Mycobacterium kansasii]